MIITLYCYTNYSIQNSKWSFRSSIIMGKKLLKTAFRGSTTQNAKKKTLFLKLCENISLCLIAAHIFMPFNKMKNTPSW